MSGLERLMIRSERWMYANGHPNRIAAALNRGWAAIAAVGLGRDRLVTLEVQGRQSGRPISLPLIVADHDGERYLVAMLGENAQWVANVRAACGDVVLLHGRREMVHLAEVAPGDRGPIVRRHLQVAPAARSFVPVDRHASIGAFDRVAARIPVFQIQPATPERAADRTAAAGQTQEPENVRMTHAAGPKTPAQPAQARSRDGRWPRRILAGLAVLVALVFMGVWAYSSLPTPAPLALPVAASSAPVGQLGGTWEVSSGSAAAFRIEQTILGLTSDIVGRTSAVSGTVVIADSQVSGATFEVDLTAVNVDGKTPPQFAISLDTKNHPKATIKLAQPVPLDAAFASGEIMTATVPALLELRGSSHSVTITISGRRDGSALQLAGSIPVTFSDWGIPDPTGYGWLASVADHASAEFSVVLDRQ